jgi:hypothetical protein
MNLKRTLQVDQRKNDKGEMALVAWEIVGTVAALIAVTSVISMIPELVRYLRLKNM